MIAYVGQTRSRALVARLDQLGIGECVVRGELPPHHERARCRRSGDRGPHRTRGRRPSLRRHRAPPCASTPSREAPVSTDGSYDPDGTAGRRRAECPCSELLSEGTENRMTDENDRSPTSDEQRATGTARRGFKLREFHCPCCQAWLGSFDPALPGLIWCRACKLEIETKPCPNPPII